MRRFNLGCLGEADCPVFDGLFEYCQVGIMVAAHALILDSADKAFLLMQIYTGGSVNSAALMNDKQADICLNWSGMTCQLPPSIQKNSCCSSPLTHLLVLTDSASDLLSALRLPVQCLHPPASHIVQALFSRRWAASCKEGRSVWLLLCQRHCVGHTGASQSSPEVPHLPFSYIHCSDDFLRFRYILSCVAQTATWSVCSWFPVHQSMSPASSLCILHYLHSSKIGPHTRSYSGLYISVPKERHMFSECTHGIHKLWLHA